MRIGAVEERTGLTRDTIHFYVREGLVHPPVKTGATVAWFDASHVQRLRAIKALRRSGVPVATVRRLLADPAIASCSEDALTALGGMLFAVGVREVPRASACEFAGRAVAETLGSAERLEESPALCDAVNALAAGVGAQGRAALPSAMVPALDAVARAVVAESRDPASIERACAALQLALPALLSARLARALEGATAAERRRAPRR
jgi:DNA-binding transcriptional MerR regulator